MGVLSWMGQKLYDTLLRLIFWVCIIMVVVLSIKYLINII